MRENIDYGFWGIMHNSVGGFYACLASTGVFASDFGMPPLYSHLVHFACLPRYRVRRPPHWGQGWGKGLPLVAKVHFG